MMYEYKIQWDPFAPDCFGNLRGNSGPALLDISGTVYPLKMLKF